MIGDNFMWFPEKALQPNSGVVVKGDTTDERFWQRDAFEIKTFGFEIECEESTEGKKAAGKGKFKKFIIDKVIDSASVPLYKACSLGAIFPTVMLAVRKSGGSPLLYLQYIFRYCQITGITWSGGSGDKLPEEKATLSFKAMGMQYIPQKPDGTEGVKNSWVWNIEDQGSCSLKIKGIDGPDPQYLPGSI